MRSFATVLSQFWTGKTGKAITAAGKDARIVATYLLTCEHANMLGLYRLPLLYVAEETGLKTREVAAALQQLQAIGFARYDEESEFVWVVEMARFQLGLLPDETLKDADHRKKGSVRIYKQIPSNPFLGPFHDRYSVVLGLPIRREFPSETKPPVSPSQGALESLTRDYGPGPGPGPDRKGDPGETIPKLKTSGGLTAEQIRDRWNAIEGVKPCDEIGKTIRVRIQTRLREHSTPEWWDGLFQRVRASDFLCGRTNGSKGPFRASLTWILSPTNLDKLRAGDYDPIAAHRNGKSGACTKPIHDGRFFRNCGQPADPKSRPNEPRCAAHLTAAVIASPIAPTRAATETTAVGTAAATQGAAGC